MLNRLVAYMRYTRDKYMFKTTKYPELCLDLIPAYTEELGPDDQ